jgi:hypothetical protein
MGDLLLGAENVKRLLDDVTSAEVFLPSFLPPRSFGYIPAPSPVGE